MKPFPFQVLIFSSLTFVFEKEATESGEIKPSKNQDICTEHMKDDIFQSSLYFFF